jgi:hypothetical protein
MAASSSYTRFRSTAPAPGPGELGNELLPRPDESPADYIARLKAFQARVGDLIETIERRRPILAPAPVAPAAPRRPVARGAGERRVAGADRRAGQRERRRGLPDARAEPAERRRGPRERRRLAFDRREELARRREPRPVPWEGPLEVNRVTMIWALQVFAWVAIAAMALIFGLG